MMPFPTPDQNHVDAAVRAILPEVFATSPFIRRCRCGVAVGHAETLCPECHQDAVDAHAERLADSRYLDDIDELNRNRFDGGKRP